MRQPGGFVRVCPSSSGPTRQVRPSFVVYFSLKGLNNGTMLFHMCVCNFSKYLQECVGTETRRVAMLPRCVNNVNKYSIGSVS